jgi:hypothetical protein
MRCEVVIIAANGELERTNCQFNPTRCGESMYANIPVFSTTGEFDHALLMKYEVDADEAALRLWMTMDGTAVHSLTKNGVLRQHAPRQMLDPVVVTDVRTRFWDHLKESSGKVLFPDKPTFVFRRIDTSLIRPNPKEKPAAGETVGRAVLGEAGVSPVEKKSP